MAISGLVLLECCLMWPGMQAQLVYKLVKIDCQGNSARVNNISCHVKAINWNLAVVNMDCVLKVFKKDYSNHYKSFLVDVSDNMCEIIQRTSYIHYGVIIWKLLKQCTYANHSCPFSGQKSRRDAFKEIRLIPPYPQGFYLKAPVFRTAMSI